MLRLDRRVHLSSRLYVLITRQAEDVPITWSRPHLMRISLVSAPSLDSSGSVVRHTNASRSYTNAVTFAGHSMAATSIFTPVLIMLNSFMLDGGKVTRVPENEKGESEKKRNEETRAAGRQNVLNKYDHHSS